MLDKTIVSLLLEVPSPVLTAYLNMQLDPSVHTPVPRCSVWLNREAKRIAEGVRPNEQQSFREQVKRIEQFIGQRIPEQKALLIVAGDSIWKVVPLPVEIENEIHWGRPAVAQLEMLLDENKLHCIVVVDRKGARLFRYWLGEMHQLAHKACEINVSQWKKKDLGMVAGQNVQKTRGSQRDVFEHRIDAQYRHFCRETANEVIRLCQLEQLHMIFLVGSKRLTQPIEAAFPKGMRDRIVSVEQDLGQLPLAELQTRLKDKIAESQTTQQLGLVTKLISDHRHAVLGVDETLTQLQKGKVRTLIFSDHLSGTLRECIECGWMNRSADPVCPICGRELRVVELRDALLDSARTTNAEIAVVTGEAASKLNDSGGIGGWLRGRTQAELR